MFTKKNLPLENQDQQCFIVSIGAEAADKKYLTELISKHLPSTIVRLQEGNKAAIKLEMINFIPLREINKLFLLVINLDDKLALLRAQQVLDEPIINNAIGNNHIMIIGNRLENTKDQYENGIKVADIPNLIEANSNLSFSLDIPLLKKDASLDKKNYDKLNLINFIDAALNPENKNKNIDHKKLKNNHQNTLFQENNKSRTESTLPLMESSSHRKCNIL